jgi:hypothetical protein
VLVLAFTAVFVRRDPSTMPPVRRHLLTLEAFVRHKSAFGLVRGKTDVEAVFQEFSTWRGSATCSGENDPRILPLHSFETDLDPTILGTSTGDRTFRDRHGPATHRTDDNGRVWDRADRGAYHAIDLQIVAGHRLPDGMHWDVTAGRSTGARLVAPHEVWKLSGARAHLNAYPDAYLRAASSAVGVSRVWSARPRSR